MSEPHSPKRLKLTEFPLASMIILVGLPGSGKSTFSTKLIQRCPHQRMIRINQDSIKNGQKGTRDMCLKAVDTALRQGIDVIIDRTNVSPDQRRFFLEAAANAGVNPSNIHAVFLNLPQKACGARAAGRQSHEGGVIGPSAYGVVGMMAKQLKKPTLDEGFASILECQNDAELDAAVELWAKYSKQLHDEDPNVLNLNEEWEKIKPKSNNKKMSGGSGLQRLDKLFEKSTNDNGASTSRAATTGTDARPTTTGAGNTNKGNNTNAFSMMMSASKQKQSNPTTTAPTDLKKPAATTTTTRHIFSRHPALSALQRYLHNPEQLLAQSTAATGASDSTVLYCDSQCVIVPDKFPKSRYHILILARDQRLLGPLDLTSADAALVRHMKTVGLQWAHEHAPRELVEEIGLSVGFHSAPSMRHLHLHIISKDYDSVCLKKKVHWNSFTTPFFLDVDWVIGQLERQQSQYLEYNVEEKEELVKGPMVCPKCRAVLARMPDVKAHVAICTGRR